MPKITRKRSTSKPAKPRPDFPLFPHASGRWAKKVRGRFVYFGRVAADTRGQAALVKWLAEKDYLLAGLPVPDPDAGAGLTIRDLCNQFLTSKQNLVDSGEITARTFADYHATCRRLTEQFGRMRPVDSLTAKDFENLRAILGKNWGPVAVGNEVNRVRVVFRYGYEAGLVDKPVRYGPNFKRPSRRILRRARDERGPRDFTADELRRIIPNCGVQLHAMVLLGVNAGLGNTDVGQLRFRNIDWIGGWLNYPRPKTSVARRAKLWPETIAALRAAIDVRPDSKDDAHRELVFITKAGKPWAKVMADSPITKEFSKVLVELKIKRPGLGFYALRHTTETVGGGARDQVALNHIMGHAPAGSDMAAVYRERIDDVRLVAVCDYVRTWLFAPKQRTTKAQEKSKPR